MSQAGVAEYCREKALFPEQLAQWRQACEQANDWDQVSEKKLKQATQDERKKNTELQKDLDRKSLVPESVLIVRPGLQVRECLLPVGGAAFLAAIDGRRTLQDIVAVLLEQEAEIDLPGLMSLLIQQGAIAHFT